MNTDPIADMLTRLRNSVRMRRPVCEMPASREKEQILKILKQSGYIKNYARVEEKPQDKLVVTHKYIGKNMKPVLNVLKRVSKPGCRIYRGYGKIQPLLGGIGITILSTPKGVLPDGEAKQLKVGGEVLCEVW